ncbi:MAG TPA: galactokinase [Acidimicrobiia bacterium]|nr:galactokinase [Acidimicrobiia bacterium]
MDPRPAAITKLLDSGTGELRWFRAPGRVNLIGDHTDYHDGFVLPLAVDRDCLIAARRRGDGRVTARSVELGDDGPVDVAGDGSDPPADIDPPWARYVAGVVRALADAGRAPVGVDAAVSSTVPVGAGLSSSAALEVAVALALADAGELALAATDLARACQRAERLATGVPSGVMDQLAALLGRAGHALLIDCRTLTAEPIALPDTLAVLVMHSGLPRTLAGSAYAERRAESERVATRLGVATLRDAIPDDVRDEPRARHVVTENQRVFDFAAALRAGDTTALGSLLLASHASLRDDYEVSTTELDLAVDLLVEHGAIGARLTGAGFGGCVVALVARHQVGDVARKTVARYRAETGLDAEAFEVRAVDGAGRLATPVGS